MLNSSFEQLDFDLASVLRLDAFQQSLGRSCYSLLCDLQFGCETVSVDCLARTCASCSVSDYGSLSNSGTTAEITENFDDSIDPARYWKLAKTIHCFIKCDLGG